MKIMKRTTSSCLIGIFVLFLGTEVMLDSVKSCTEENEDICLATENKDTRRCFGYEGNCHVDTFNICSRKEYVSKKDYERANWDFWRKNDFGYVSFVRENMLDLCVSKEKYDSSLRCARDLMYCHATNLYIDLTKHNFAAKNFFKKIPFSEGEIGGKCELNKDLLSKQNKYPRDLYSWTWELEDYSQLTSNPFHAVPPFLPKCEEIIYRPSYIVKLDQGENMYHHFCDFINIYVSQHVNGSGLSTDINIVHWNTGRRDYDDHHFIDVWDVFTRHPIINLRQYKGKRVCFKDAVFSIPPRRPDALFYNVKVIPHCNRSRLVRTFSNHILDRLNIRRSAKADNKTRVTFLVRSTTWRRIVNQDELYEAMQSVTNVTVTMVDFSTLSFTDQLEIIVNTDVFVSIHGAGLTHIMFLPEGAAVFELYHCGNPNCYMRLAQLCNVRYFPMEDENKFEAVDKKKGREEPTGYGQMFWNYRFDVDEVKNTFVKVVHEVRKST